MQDEFNIISIFDSETELDKHIENFSFLEEKYQRHLLDKILTFSDNFFHLLDLKSRYFIFCIIVKFHYLLDYQFLYKSLTKLCDKMFVDQYTNTLNEEQINNLISIFNRPLFQSFFTLRHPDWAELIYLSSLSPMTTSLFEEKMIKYYHEDYDFHRFFSRYTVAIQFMNLAEYNQFADKRKIFSHLLKINRSFALDNFAARFKDELGIYTWLA